MIKGLAKGVLTKSKTGLRILSYLRTIRHFSTPRLGDPVFPDSDYKEYRSLAGPVYIAGISDPDFLAINRKYPEHFSPGSSENNRYIQYVLSRNALSVAGGDLIECGILTGKSFDIFANVVDQWDTLGRKIYGFDSFQGFAAPDERDLDVRSGRQAFEKGSCRGWDKQTISNALSYHKCPIELIQGWIPDCFAGYEQKQFCFAHIDVDLYRSTYDTISYIYPRMLKGGIILFDDYGFPMVPGSRKAVDDYLQDKSETIISLLTGQAFIIKQ